MSGEPVFAAAGLVKTFGALRAVDGVSMTISAGEIYGLVGPSGSGKSSSMRAGSPSDPREARSQHAMPAGDRSRSARVHAAGRRHTDLSVRGSSSSADLRHGSAADRERRPSPAIMTSPIA
jgi:ABC-type glutathione transport system ATPase component